MGFPEQDTYIYRNGDGTRNVVTVLRRVQNGRRYLGIDFWYSHYYLVGRYGIPDFYKLEKYSDKDDIHKEDKPVILVTKPRARTCYVTCHVTTETTTPTTTYTTTTPTTTPTTTTPTTTPCNGFDCVTTPTTPTTTTTTTYTTTTTPTEPTICPYGKPYRVC